MDRRGLGDVSYAHIFQGIFSYIFNTIYRSSFAAVSGFTGGTALHVFTKQNLNFIKRRIIYVEWINKRVLVIGAGLSGQAAVRKLQRLGAEVFLTDSKVQEQLAGVEVLELDRAHLLLGSVPEFGRINPELRRW